MNQNQKGKDAELFTREGVELYELVKKDDELFERAEKGDTSILSDPRVAIAERIYGVKMTPLHVLAKKGFTDVLAHPDCAKVCDRYDQTPLHYLARIGCTEVLRHPDVASVRDNEGQTPLPRLARHEVAEVANHPEAATVVDKHGDIPLMNLRREDSRSRRWQKYAEYQENRSKSKGWEIVAIWGTEGNQWVGSDIFLDPKFATASMRMKSDEERGIWISSV